MLMTYICHHTRPSSGSAGLVSAINIYHLSYVYVHPSDEHCKLVDNDCVSQTVCDLLQCILGLS